MDPTWILYHRMCQKWCFRDRSKIYRLPPKACPFSSVTLHPMAPEEPGEPGDGSTGPAQKPWRFRTRKIHRKMVVLWENHRKTHWKIVVLWENHRKTHRKMVVLWENHRKIHWKMVVLPSGKRSKNYGESPCVLWENSLFLWPFSIVVCMFTRGYVLLLFIHVE